MTNKKNTKKRIIKGKDFITDKRQDGLRVGKRKGCRVSNSNRVPTKKEIQEHYDGASNGVYMESRVNRSDFSTRAKKGERFEKGGSIDSSIKFHLNDYNKLLDADEYDSIKNGNVWEIKDIETSKVYGKYNKEKGTLVIVGKKDLSNPLVVWLKDNSYISSDNVNKLVKGGKIDSFKGKTVLIKDSIYSNINGKKVKVLEEDINENGDTILALDIEHPEDENTKLWVNSSEVEIVEKLATGGEVKNRTTLTEEEKQFVREESQEAGQGYTYRTKVLRGEHIILKEKDGQPIQKFTVDNFEVGSKMSAMLNKANDKEKKVKLNKVDRSKAVKKTSVNGNKKLAEGGSIERKKWLKDINDKRLSELKLERDKIEKEYSDDYVEVSGSGRNKAQILADFDEAILERENNEFANGGEIKGRGWGDFKKGKRISDSAKDLKVGKLYLKHSPQFNSENIVLITKEDTTGLNRDIVYGSFVRPNDLEGKEENFAIWGHDLNSDEYYEIDGMEYEKGGSIGFEGLAKKVAKEYVGDKVKPEYQDEYGKRYDKEEAKEVGAKVAAKVYRMQQGKMEQGGEVKGMLSLSEIESKLGKTFSFWNVPYEVSVNGNTYRKILHKNEYRKI